MNNKLINIVAALVLLLVINGCVHRNDRHAFENINDVEKLIAQYQISGICNQDIISQIDQRLNHVYDPILFSIYLSHALQQEKIPQNTLQRLQIFETKDSDNFYPHFLLSYYYFKKTNCPSH